MANSTWGEKGWSIGEFGTGAENITLTLEGQSLSSSLNSVLITAEVNNGWGAYTWGLTGWGTNTASPTVEVTGQNLITSLNSVSLSINGSVLLTNQLLTLSLGEENIIGTANLTLDTNLSNLTLNSVGGIPGITVSVTAPGTPTTWGSNGWGQLGWGENIGLTTSEGSSTIDLITPVNIQGQSLTLSLGDETVTGTGNVSLTGQSLTLSLGEENVIINANINLTGQLLTLTEGSVDPAPDADVTGIQLTTTLNNNGVIVDIAVVAYLTGQQLTSSLGNETVDLNTPVNVTGQGLTLSLNPVVTKLNVTANVTGFGLTGKTGQLYVAAWTPVDTGQSIVWTEVAA
jgi:hypothetical protein